jgi:hypothetical protein
MNYTDITNQYNNIATESIYGYLFIIWIYLNIIHNIIIGI